MKVKLIIVVYFLLMAVALKAQHNDGDLVQFSGVIVTADSLRPVPFTHILVEKTNRGTTSDYFGKKMIVGNSVSHSNIKTKRKFYPNLQTKRFYIPEEDEWITLKVSAAAIRTINKKGISAVLKEVEKKGKI